MYILGLGLNQMTKIALRHSLFVCILLNAKRRTINRNILKSLRCCVGPGVVANRRVNVLLVLGFDEPLRNVVHETKVDFCSEICALFICIIM